MKVFKWWLFFLNSNNLILEHNILAYATICSVLWHSVFCINWHCSILFYDHNTRALCDNFDRYETITEIKEKILYKLVARYKVLQRSSWGRFTNNKRFWALLKCCLLTTHTSAWHGPVWITNKFHAVRARLTESRIFPNRRRSKGLFKV